MSEKFTPWDELFGPYPTPENPVVPTPPPVVAPVIVPTPQPAPNPIIPAPVTPVSPPSSKWQTILAASIVAAGMLGAGFFLSKNAPTPQPVNPPGPVLPVVDASLSKLLPDANARLFASSYFRDVSRFIETSKTLKTSGQAIQAIAAGMKDLQTGTGSVGWAAINTPISERVIKAMGSTPTEGMPDLGLDTPHLNGMTPRQILVKEYAQIAADLKGG